MTRLLTNNAPNTTHTTRDAIKNVFETMFFRQMCAKHVGSHLFFWASVLGFSPECLYRRADAHQTTGMFCSSFHGICVLCSRTAVGAKLLKQLAASSLQANLVRYPFAL